MYYETQTAKGEYRCAVRVEKIRPLGRNEYAAKVERIFLILPPGSRLKCRSVSAEAYTSTTA